MIYVEDQEIKLNGVILPGLVKSIDIKESGQIEEQEVEGSAVKAKQAIGYEDTKVNIDLVLDDTPTATKYQRLAVLRGLFRKPDQSVPQPIPIVCEATAVHGVSSVLFKSISHVTSASKSQLEVSLEFWEYRPQTIKTTTSNAASSAKKSSSKSGSGGTSSNLTGEYKSYVSTNRGKSPAIDDAATSTSLNKVSQLS